MDETAERDQFKANAAEWAWQLRVNYDALVAAGFSADQALALLAHSFTQNAGALQASAVDRFLRRIEDDD